MEKVQEHRQECKLCSKSFLCGRSLGGHIRSHAINDFQTIEKNPKTKLKSVHCSISDQNPNYSLRESPQKSSRFRDADEDDKLCNQCGRGFQSWKALFGHMKCHSNKLSDAVKEDSDSLISANRELEMDNQLGNEIEVPRKKKKRSRRGKNWYKGSSEISSVSEIEQEQEEVALCLIMLSRDLRFGNRGFCSASESSNNNFDIDEIGSSLRSTKDEKNKGKHSLSSLKFKKLSDGKLESTISGSENSQLDVENKFYFGSEEKKECAFNGEEENGFISTEAQFRMKQSKGKVNQDRIKFRFEDFDINNNKRCLSEKFSDGNCYNEKRIKFECTSCNKNFHSYQALGGHRACHKKFKGCFVTKVENIEKTIETRMINPKHESKTTPQDKDSVFLVSQTNFASKKNKNKAHFECPICFKVFSSGQAMGGHKRSHVIVGADAKINPTSVIRNQIPEVRDFLDLNLPAPTEGKEEENSELKPWWVNGNDNVHETLIHSLLN